MSNFRFAMSIKFLVVFFILYTPIYARQTGVSFETNEILSRKVPKWAFKYESTIQALPLYSEVKGGFVYSNRFELKKKYRFRPKSRSVKDVLDSIVKANPEYIWQLVAGRIYLFPRSGLPSLLKVVISEFQVSDISDLSGFDHLENLPEFMQKAKQLGYGNFDRNYSIRRIHRLGYDVRFSLDCKNSTIMELLDAYVRESGRHRWSFVEFTERGKKWFEIAYA